MGYPRRSYSEPVDDGYRIGARRDQYGNLGPGAPKVEPVTDQNGITRSHGMPGAQVMAHGGQMSGTYKPTDFGDVLKRRGPVPDQSAYGVGPIGKSVAVNRITQPSDAFTPGVRVIAPTPTAEQIAAASRTAAAQGGGSGVRVNLPGGDFAQATYGQPSAPVASAPPAPAAPSAAPAPAPSPAPASPGIMTRAGQAIAAAAPVVAGAARNLISGAGNAASGAMTTAGNAVKSIGSAAGDAFRRGTAGGAAAVAASPAGEIVRGGQAVASTVGREVRGAVDAVKSAARSAPVQAAKTVAEGFTRPITAPVMAARDIIKGGQQLGRKVVENVKGQIRKQVAEDPFRMVGSRLMPGGAALQTLRSVGQAPARALAKRDAEDREFHDAYRRGEVDFTGQPIRRSKKETAGAQ